MHQPVHRILIVFERLRTLAPAAAIAVSLTGLAQAQPAADPPPPPADAPAAPPASEPAPATSAAPPAETPPAAPPPEAAPAAAPEPAPEKAEEEKEKKPFEKKLTIGAGARTGLNFLLSPPGGGKAQLTLSDGLVDQVNIRPFMAGSLTENFGYFVQFEIGTPNGLGPFHILDGIAQMKFLDEVQLWVGQHIPANDRNNMNGPFFGNTWNFAITVPSYPFDTGARDRGATLWGLIAGGRVKYHLSMVDLQPGQQMGNARFAGRLTVHLLEPEAFYYNSGTYFGEKDVLALGAVFQSQKGVRPPEPADPTDPASVGSSDNGFGAFSFDAFFEKNLGAGGTLTAEVDYWNFKGVGPGYVVNQGTVDARMGVAGPYPGQAFMGVLSWLTPDKVGIGKIQPNARVQYGDYDSGKVTTIDAGLAYVVDGFNHKYHLNYRHENMEPVGADKMSADSIQVGAQFMMSN